MATMKTISAALKLVDVKKENLRKAFEALQSHSSSLSSFTLTWSDLDSYFTSFQSSLEHKFKLLQSEEPQSQSPASKPSSKQQPSSSLAINDSSDLPLIPARAELKSFCEKMDGMGLRRYIVERPTERDRIRAELSDALRCAPDAAAMVLDAMEGFYLPNSKGEKDMELGSVRRGCVVLLEELMEFKPEIKPEVRERATKLAAEWKGKVGVIGDYPLEALGFLHLLGTYGLVDNFKMEELLDFAVVVARYRQAIKLCWVLGFGDRMSDLIQKLISKGKQLLAIKFIFKFELTDKFPPVPLLKDYVKESKKLALKVRKGGKHTLQSLNEATMKEVSALNSVIKYIEDYNLDSEYPKENLVKRIENLEKEKADRKRPAPKPLQPSKPQKKQSGGKRPRTTAAAGPAAVPRSVAAPSSTVPPFQPPHLQVAGLLPNGPAPHLGSPDGPYGLAGSTPAVAPYLGSSAGLYGLAGTSLGFMGNLAPTVSHQYPSETHMPSGYFDRPIAYGGYGLPPQYHPSYYPQ
uniref:FRIGIDA-like protein n=1 Tax=Davidia involucrata TaxID=16924 RepID=A0A5B7BCW5_DAVIN